MKKIYLLTAAAALALTACDNDNSDDNPVELPSSTNLRISASINEASLSRAEGGSWDAGDRIGINTTIGELAAESFHPYVNLLYTADNEGSSTSLSGPVLLFYNHLTISGYYPYQGSENSAPGGDADGYLIKNNTRLGNQFENNKTIDFIHATKTGIKLADAPNVELAFSHKMTKLTFTFYSDTDKKNKVNVANLAKYQIEGLVMDGSFDTLTGECSVDSDQPAENLIIDGLFINTDGNQNPESRTMESLILFPQTPTGDVTLRMFLDEAHLGNENDYQVYFCTIKFGDNRLKPGYHYNFKVNITKAGLQLGNITISDWGKGVNTSIIATIDGEEPDFDENEEN